VPTAIVSIHVGGSRNEGAALKRSAPHFDKQADFKVDWLYSIGDGPKNFIFKIAFRNFEYETKFFYCTSKKSLDRLNGTV
jgi:hypothetical protein